MSSHLHVFPADFAQVRSYFKEQGLNVDDVPLGRGPSREEFLAALDGLQPYDYDWSADGSMDLRRGTSADLYAIISRVARKCGTQLIISDDVELFVFSPSVTFEEFRTWNETG
jgi:hypothetical protein